MQILCKMLFVIFAKLCPPLVPDITLTLAKPLILFQSCPCTNKCFLLDARMAEAEESFGDKFDHFNDKQDKLSSTHGGKSISMLPVLQGGQGVGMNFKA